MKLECSTQSLKNGIMKAQKITVKNSTLPVLGSILIIAKEKLITLRSTNLHIGVEIKLPANIETEGDFIVSGEILLNVISNISNETIISLEVVEDTLIVNNKHNTVNIKRSGEIADFPTIPVVEGESFDLPVESFLEGIKSVYYCSAVSDIKPEISSVYMYSKDSKLYFVSTDSFRLAEKSISIPNLPEIPGIMIPYKNIIEIIKLLSDAEDFLTITSSENQISFEIPGFYLSSSIINGNFPDYRQIIPSEFQTEVVLLKKDLQNALRLSNIFSDKFNQVALKVSSEDKSIEMYAKNADVGENTTLLDGAIEGDSIEMNFNHKYFTEGFQSIYQDSIVLKFNAENRPVIVEGVGDSSFLYLIMPMNR